jgi:hypothetical protein
MGLFTIVLTCALQILPRQAFINQRFLWVYIWLEFAAMNGYTLIVHQNRLEELYGHNIIVAIAFIYCQSMPKRGGDILENIYYGDMLLSQVPSKIANETSDY